MSAPNQPSLLARLVRLLVRAALTLSVALNLLILLLVAKVLLWSWSLTEEGPLRERHYAGKRLSAEKVAIVRIDGVLMEGMTAFARRQIEEAAANDSVKAVVVRIDSPGGTITASDDIYRRLTELRDGSPSKGTQPKPLVASMGSVAASGGYYIAMAAPQVVAERSTLTGSIGVYAAFPNVAELAGRYGVKMNVIKAGRVKDSGSMFHEMTPAERQVWQDMVDHAYGQFLDTVRQGRGQRLKHSLVEDIPVPAGAASAGGRPAFARQLADGGIFTADRAKDYGLIDEVGYLDDAVAAARRAASLGHDCHVITYERPYSSLFGLLLADPTAQTARPDGRRLARALQPRLWYLAPQCDLAGILAATED